MHPYAVNLSERHRVPFVIAAVAFLIAWIISVLSTSVGWRPPYWLEVPGTLTFYTIGIWIFGTWLWKIRGLRVLLNIKTPDLTGEWTGFVKTSFDEHATQHDVSVSIRQTWTDLSITLKSAWSSSESLGASIIVDAFTTIVYEYANTPRPGSATTMHAHRGTARLQVDPSANRLEGEYYSGRDRANQGILILMRRA